MARFTTTDGSRSVESTLTTTEAANICGRIPSNHKDREFAYSLIRAFNRYGANLTQNRRVWLHILANQQLRREQPAPVMQSALPAPKPVVAAPVAPATPAAPVAPEAPLMGADEIAKAAAGQSLTMLMYDIPDAAEIANPSGRLRRIGIRLNKSVWLVPTGSVPHYLISELQNVGSSVITAPYDVNAAAGLLQAAITFANREMAEAAKRAAASKAEAEAELNSPDGDPNAKRRAYDRKIQAITKRLNALADEMKVGGDVFGVSGALNFRTLRNAAASISATTTTRATVYANTVATLESIPTVDAQAMAVAMKADEGNALIAADMIQDADTDGTKTEEAEGIRAAFDDSATPEENETFSLADWSNE